MFGIAMCSEALMDEVKTLRRISGQLLAFSSTDTGRHYSKIKNIMVSRGSQKRHSPLMIVIIIHVYLINNINVYFVGNYNKRF